MPATALIGPTLMRGKEVALGGRISDRGTGTGAPVGGTDPLATRQSEKNAGHGQNAPDAAPSQTPKRPRPSHPRLADPSGAFQPGFS